MDWHLLWFSVILTGSLAQHRELRIVLSSFKALAYSSGENPNSFLPYFLTHYWYSANIPYSTAQRNHSLWSICCCHGGWIHYIYLSEEHIPAMAGVIEAKLPKKFLKCKREPGDMPLDMLPLLMRMCQLSYTPFTLKSWIGPGILNTRQSWVRPRIMPRLHFLHDTNNVYVCFPCSLFRSFFVKGRWDGFPNRFV